MRYLIALALALFGAFPALAETIPIRTGEHGDFSRLVLPLDRPAEGWRFGRIDDGYQLRLGRGDVHFDLTKVFDKIPKTRLTAIEADDAKGWLTLRLACRCYAEIFPFRETLLVVDIRPGAPPKNSPFEVPLHPADTPPPASLPPEDTDPVETGTRAAPAFVWHGLQGPFLPPPGPPEVAMPKPENPAVTKAREALLQQLARAGTQGLIRVDPKQLAPARAEDPPPHPDHAPAPVPDESVSHPGEKAPSLGMRARTVMDRDAPEVPAPGLASEGQPCPPDDALDIGAWAGDAPPSEQIAKARRALVGEFDTPSPEGAETLARLYLGLGLGAEARAVLTAFPQTGGKDRAILLGLAATLDQDRPDLARALSGFGACPGKAALWSMLASPPPGPGEPVDANAVRRTFSGLPLAMRRALGPRLAQAFLDRGDKDTALSLRDAVARAADSGGDGNGDGLRMTEARIDMAEGNHSAAEQTIAPVIRRDGPDAPEAMVLLVDTRIARDEMVDTGTIEALAALAHETRGTAIGSRLTRAHALALGTAGEFADAFAEMGDDPEGAPRLWNMLARRGSDEDLLRAAITPPAIALGTETRRRIADRLIGLGFGTAAEAWIRLDNNDDTQQRKDMARAALAQGDAAAALTALSGLNDPEAEALRARAHALAGDHHAATQAYMALGDVQQAGAEAWRAGDTATARKIASDLQKTALSLQESAPKVAPQDTASGPLARDKARIDDSRRAREALTRLLAETPSTLGTPGAAAQAATH